MSKGILENFRGEVGLTIDQFKDSEFYAECQSVAQNVTAQMINSRIIQDFQEVSQLVKKLDVGEELIGPTGHCYLVTEENFRSSYANYLQSFEFGLISKGTLNCLLKHPKAEIIGHYHDGNVIALPKGDVQQFLSDVGEEVSGLGSALGLRSRQRIELKRLYPQEVDLLA